MPPIKGVLTHPRRTQQVRAMENPKTNEAVNRLCAKWPKLNPVQRGDRLQKAIAAGCTIRGLATQLGIDDKGVRRFLDIAALPGPAREAIAAGANPESYLRQSKDAAIEAAAWARARREDADGTPSDDLADKITWALVREGGGLDPQYLFNVLDYAERIAFDRTACVRRIDTPGRPAPVSHEFSFLRLIGMCRYTDPDVLEDQNPMNTLAEVVLRWEQVPRIRTAAFTKATALLKLKNCPAEYWPHYAKTLDPAAFGRLLRTGSSAGTVSNHRAA